VEHCDINVDNMTKKEKRNPDAVIDIVILTSGFVCTRTMMVSVNVVNELFYAFVACMEKQ
jgi:hypothetical protein